MAADKSNRVLRHTRAAVELLAERGPLGPPEVARELGIPRPSAYRLLSALGFAGLAHQDKEGLFSLSTAWLRLGDAALDTASAWFTHDKLLETLRDDTGLTVYLAIPRKNRTVCVRRLHGRNYRILALRPGGSLALHLGGVGRVTLAFGQQTPEDYLEHAPFEPETPYSLTTRAQLEADVDTSRRDGATLSDQDVTLGVAALAVPVCQGGDLLAAVSVAGRREDIVERIPALKQLLVRTADKISADA